MQFKEKQNTQRIKIVFGLKGEIINSNPFDHITCFDISHFTLNAQPIPDVLGTSKPYVQLNDKYD